MWGSTTLAQGKEKTSKTYMCKELNYTYDSTLEEH